ncbi:outer membrane protein transport protein [Psychrobacter urativorans]|uniref:outer membrane protein transport protein n=1 Tax=Psychrobacter urativorans TaxID=45610 RepID=UPI00191A8376|nr:outer membrane protein transport protein [Psychrobacter urativorans]
MRPTFYLKNLAVAVAAFSVASIASAAGLDRSGQDITAFLQDGLYAEASYTYLDADVTGHDNAYIGEDNKAYQQGKKIDDAAESYDFFRYGVKADINDTFSVGILYDEPFGAAASYSGDNNFVAMGDRDAVIKDVTGNPAYSERVVDNVVIPTLQKKLAPGNPQNLSPVELQEAKAQLTGVITAKKIADAEEATKGEGTNVEVRTESITAILGMKLGENKNFQVYGGPVAQRVQADVKLRGLAYGPATGYTAHISPDQDYGWLAGVSYSKPEIALQAALTYRSEIDHNLPIFESYPLASAASGGALPTSRADSIDITTPKSVNFDFQTGINPTMLATAKVRWVPWSDFAIVPPLYTGVSKAKYPEGLPLVSYDKDQWLVELGLAKRLTPALAVTGNIGWDSGAGDPVTSLGPIDGYYSAGLGAKYNVTENWAVSAGGKYLWFGDAKGQLPTKDIVGNFEDNDGYALGVKVSYQAK